MREWVLNAFGVYTPITYTDNGVDIIPSGMAGVDWQYICGVAVFLCIVVCTFKLIGTLIKGK